MRKKALKKVHQATTVARVERPQYKNVSTQTYRYVEYIPLPIVVDIKSENESDDAASYTEPFADDIPYTEPIIETLKIEINETGAVKATPDSPAPMIEEFLFEDEMPAAVTYTESPMKPKSKLKSSASAISKVPAKRKKSQSTRKPTNVEPKVKKANKSHSGEHLPRGRPRKSAAQADFVECSLCSFKCQRPSHLKRHLLMHTGERPHQCEHCSKSFAQKTDLNRHMTSHAALFNYHCGSCGRGFSEEDTMKKHQQRCNTKRYTCDLCNYMTFSVGNLDLHKRKHTGERPFACSSCDKRFTRVAHLNQHVKLHANDFEMHCQMCGRGFADEDELCAHEMTCKNRMFQCHMCHDPHIRMDNLRRHIKITHMGEKEILCEYCSKQFPAKSSLTKHIKLKHPERIQS